MTRTTRHTPGSRADTQRPQARGTFTKKTTLTGRSSDLRIAERRQSNVLSRSSCGHLSGASHTFSPALWPFRLRRGPVIPRTMVQSDWFIRSQRRVRGGFSPHFPFHPARGNLQSCTYSLVVGVLYQGPRRMQPPSQKKTVNKPLGPLAWLTRSLIGKPRIHRSPHSPCGHSGRPGVSSLDRYLLEQLKSRC